MIAVKTTFRVIAILCCAIILFLLFCAFINQPAISKLTLAVKYIWLKDFELFKSSFPQWYSAAFFLLRILPLIVVAFIICRQIFRWYSKKIPQNYKLYLTQVFLIFFLLSCAECYLRAKNFHPNSFYAGLAAPKIIEDCSAQYSDSTGIIRMKQGSKFLPPFITPINNDG